MYIEPEVGSTHNQTIIMFSNDYDSQIGLVKIIEEKYKLIKCSYDVSSYNSIEAYKASVSTFVFDNLSNDFNTSWLLSRISEQGLLDSVPVAFTTIEAFDDFNKLGYEVFACDILSLFVTSDLVARRLSNLVDMYILKQQISHLTQIHSKRLMVQANKLREQTHKMHKLNFDLIELMVAAIESRDVESGQHIKRIRYFAKSLLEAVATECPEYNLTDEQVEIISLASAVHDIGKISIPDAILLKPARLTKEEFELMKAHTTKGARLLNMLEGIGDSVYFQYCREICLSHHERWDGKGYPNGLKGDDIPISAQVVSVADCYDALTSERPYKHALSHEEAVNLIKNGACGAFSPQLMKCFDWRLSDFKRIEEEFKNNPLPSKLQDELADNMEIITEKLADLPENNLSAAIIEKYMQIIINSHDIIFEANLESDEFTLHKGNWSDLFGYIPRNMIEALSQVSSCCHPDDLESFTRNFSIDEFRTHAKEGRKKVRAEFRINANNGEELLAEGSVILLTDDKNELKSICATFNGYDSSVYVKEAKPKFKTHDALTDLFIESAFQKEVEIFLNDAPEDAVCFMLYIDIDGMTYINNTTGYEFGNKIIKGVADRILETVGKKDCIICRLSGDKFGIFIKDAKRKVDAVLFIESLHKNLKKEYVTASGSNFVTVTIGASRYPEDGKDYRTLVTRASYASDISKLNGNDMYAFYNSSIDNYRYFENSFFYDLQSQGEDNTLQYEPRYIPVYDKKSDSLIGYDYLPFSILNDVLPIPSDFFREALTLFKNKKHISIIQIKELVVKTNEIIEKTGESPLFSIFTYLSQSDIPAVLQQLSILNDTYPKACNHICLCLPQTFLDNISWRNLRSFADSVRSFGFSLGVYLVCDKSLSMLCMSEGIFDRIILAGEFAEKGFTGFFPPDFLSHTIDNLSFYTSTVTIPTILSEINTETLFSYDCTGFSTYESIIIGTDNMLEHFSKQYTKEDIVSREKEKASIINPLSFVFALDKSKCLIIQQDYVTGVITYSNNTKRVLGYSLKDSVSNKELDFESFIHKDDIKTIQTSLAKAKGNHKNVICKARVLVRSAAQEQYQIFNFAILPTADSMGVTTMTQMIFLPED